MAQDVKNLSTGINILGNGINIWETYVSNWNICFNINGRKSLILMVENLINRMITKLVKNQFKMSWNYMTWEITSNFWQATFRNISRNKNNYLDRAKHQIICQI